MRQLWKKNGAITSIICLAAALRLPLLNGSFWLDEAAQALESARPLTEQLNIAHDFQPPLIHLLTWLTMQVAASEWWLRLWAAFIPGLISIWVTYRLGVLLVGKKPALLAAGLLATNSFHIFYSQELRPYALPLMLGGLSWLWIVQKKPTPYLITTALGLYASYLYPFLVAAQLLFLSLQTTKAERQAWWRTTVIAGCLFVPWLPFFWNQLAAGQAVRVSLPGWERVVSTPQFKALALVPLKFVYGVIDLQITPLLLFSIGIIAVSGLLSGWLFLRRADSKQLKTLKLLSIWVIVPLLTSWLISFAIPVIQPKRLLFLLPGFYLLISFVATQKKLNLTLSSLVQKIFLGTLLIINGISTLTYYLNPRVQRENWRELHQEITRRFDRHRTIAVFAFPEPFAPWIWYDKGAFAAWSTGQLNTAAVPDLSQRFKPVTEYETVLLFEYLRDLTDPGDLLRTELWSLGYTEIETLDYPNIGFVRVYARHKPIATQE